MKRRFEAARPRLPAWVIKTRLLNSTWRLLEPYVFKKRLLAGEAPLADSPPLRLPVLSIRMAGDKIPLTKKFQTFFVDEQRRRQQRKLRPLPHADSISRLEERAWHPLFLEQPQCRTASDEDAWEIQVIRQFSRNLIDTESREIQVIRQSSKNMIGTESREIQVIRQSSKNMIGTESRELGDGYRAYCGPSNYPTHSYAPSAS
ncbi:Protein of unknown function [Pyronema omphalodes CBS 100304]|uniref:Uncharacterized protein n=1 Tax=Pyronema omphalodes (strain CBS 100304) TaxID=1076935 RepID=U4LKY7_PYROM|nr:Protein of unknown function [Pyronema omphalodes CBS 100304]